MITVILLNSNAETKILQYDTESEEEACKRFIEEWKQRKIIWDHEETNLAFTKEWLDKYSLESLEDHYEKQYEKNVRIVSWYYLGQSESDDEFVTGFLIHSEK